MGKYQLIGAVFLSALASAACSGPTAVYVVRPDNTCGAGYGQDKSPIADRFGFISVEGLVITGDTIRGGVYEEVTKRGGVVQDRRTVTFKDENTFKIRADDQTDLGVVLRGEIPNVDLGSLGDKRIRITAKVGRDAPCTIQGEDVIGVDGIQAGTILYKKLAEEGQ